MSRGSLRLAFLEIYSECLADKTDFWPGMDEVVDALDAQSIVWGIVTNKVMRFTEPLLKQINLWDRCAVVVGGDTTTHAKPHPAPKVWGGFSYRADLELADSLTTVFAQLSTPLDS